MKNSDFDEDSSISFDAFTKKFGLEDESVLLITVFVNEEGADFLRLWSIYRGWLHDGLDMQAILGPK